MNDELTKELLAMQVEDERVRTELAATGELFEGYAPRMARVHLANAQRLENIIEDYGWPGRSLVGDAGAHAAWLVLQHVIGSPELQRGCVPLLRDAVARGDALASQLAFLEDRICFFERRPQRYGTQLDWDERGQLSPWQLEDEGRVDDYRQAVGLEPLSEAVARVRLHADAENQERPNFRRRQLELETWAKSVGWLK